MQILLQSGDLGPKWFHVSLRAMTLMGESQTLLKSNYISEMLGEDATNIRKILAKLIRADLVSVKEGRYGGYTLSRNTGDITVLEVYKAFEENTTPYWSVPSTGSELFISSIISKAEEQFQSSLAGFTIEDIIKHKVKL